MSDNVKTHAILVCNMIDLVDTAQGMMRRASHQLFCIAF